MTLMPQIKLTISHNINTAPIDFQSIFAAMHAALHDIGNINIASCNSGMIQEDISYIGSGDPKYTRVYLEVYWLEDEHRLAIKNQVGLQLIKILKDMLVPLINEQQLICVPRVRIADLGEIDQDYYIGK